LLLLRAIWPNSTTQPAWGGVFAFPQEARYTKRHASSKHDLEKVKGHKRQIKDKIRDNIVSDTKKNFHELVVKSSLFKGRGDWYFCFLKSERIAHVLVVLASNVSEDRRGELLLVSRSAGMLPGKLVRFAAGAIAAEVVLADLLATLSLVRLLQTSGILVKENAQILAQEYEALIEKFAASVHLSPFASAQDFAVPQVEQSSGDAASVGLLERLDSSGAIKDVKGQSIFKGQDVQKLVSKGQQERVERIRDFVLKNKGVSIKDIAQVVQGCSEKTIQRELAVLIQQGVIKKVGERRWSLYMPAL